MGKRITTVNEIKNIVSLGLDVWVAPPVGVSTEAWNLKNPTLTKGVQGLMFGSQGQFNHQYLPLWGIKDPDWEGNIFIYDGNEYRLYNTQQDAQNAINTRMAGLLNQEIWA